MNEDDIRETLENLGVPSDKVDEAAAIISRSNAWGNEETSVNKLMEIIFNLQQQAEATDDWREKARLNARIISEKMDDYYSN